MRIKALVGRSSTQSPAIEPVVLDEPREGEILVRLVAAGVARLDCDALAGLSPMPFPFVPGSEAAGIVERVGPGVTVPVAGDAILVAPAACHACPACLAGDPGRCHMFHELNLRGTRDDGTVPFRDRDGGRVHGFFHGQSAFGTHLICRAADAIVVADGAALEVLAILPGAFLRGAAAVLRLQPIGEADAVVIVGTNLIGLAACLTARALGVAMVIVVALDEQSRQLATDVGANFVVPTADDLPAAVEDLVPGGRVRLALDSIGTDAALQACRSCVGLQGTCVSVADAAVLAAFNAASAEAGLDARALVPRLAELHARGSLPLEQLIDFFAFEHVHQALEATRTRAVVKAVLRFPLGSFGEFDRAASEGAAVEEPEDEGVEPAVAQPVSA